MISCCLSVCDWMGRMAGNCDFDNTCNAEWPPWAASRWSLKIYSLILISHDRIQYATTYKPTLLLGGSRPCYMIAADRSCRRLSVLHKPNVIDYQEHWQTLRSNAISKHLEYLREFAIYLKREQFRVAQNDCLHDLRPSRYIMTTCLFGAVPMATDWVIT